MDSDDLFERLNRKLAIYKPSAAAVALLRDTKLVFLVGISGAGKDTLRAKLMESGKYYCTISYTTREPRVNDGVPEQDAVDYHFINLEIAEQMLDRGDYIEAKRFGQNIYGSAISEVKLAHDAHLIAITDLEVQGIAEYMAMAPHTKPIFILPPSFDVWQDRLRNRYGMSLPASVYEERMRINHRELEHVLRTPYFYFVINDDLTTAANEIDRIAQGKEVLHDTLHARQVAESIKEQLETQLAGVAA